MNTIVTGTVQIKLSLDFLFYLVYYVINLKYYMEHRDSFNNGEGKDDFIMNKTADLHIHTYYSDGTMSPEEIVEEALRNNVGLIAVTDHDVIEGSQELQKLCEGKDITCLTGAELNALEDGLNYHILSYGVNLQNEDFIRFVKQNRAYLETVNAVLIERMQEDDTRVSVADYDAFSHNPRKGGWKALQYLMAKGITGSLREGFAYYTKYNCTYEVADFPTIRVVCEQIHKAGGKAVLAHPGVSIKEDDLSRFRNRLVEFIDFGLDGIECYYITHTEEITKLCLDLGRERNLLITAGSDCHGDFGSARIGDVNVPVECLQLGGLL